MRHKILVSAVHNGHHLRVIRKEPFSLRQFLDDERPVSTPQSKSCDLRPFTI